MNGMEWSGRYRSVCGEDELRHRLRNIRHAALDMDGTIYTGRSLFPFTRPFLERLSGLGIGFSFLTNNPSQSVGDYIQKLAAMGITADRRQIYTTSAAAIEYLQREMPSAKRLFLLGTPSMTGEFESAGFTSTADSADDRPEAVVVAFDKTLEYSRLCRAAWWVAQGLPYIATNPDLVCPTDERTVLVDCGSICAALEKATGRRPDITLGKPDPELIRNIARREGVAVEEIAVVGDRLYTDIAAAQNAGAFSVLTLTGETTPESAADAEPQPHLTVSNIGILGDLLAEARKQP